MTSKRLIEMIQAADPTGKKEFIITDAAGNWIAKPYSVWAGRYSPQRNATSLDLPLSPTEKKAGHKEEHVLIGKGVKKVVILSIDQ